MVNLNYNPFFFDIRLGWLQAGEVLILGLILLWSHLSKRNNAALMLALGNFSTFAAFLVALLSVHLYPTDYVAQSWYSNVIGEFLVYVGYTYFCAALLYVQFPQISTKYALSVLGVGLFVTFTSIIYFQAPTGDPSIGLDYHRTFLTEFVPTIIGMIFFIGLTEFFAKQLPNQKYRLSALLIIVGLILGSFSLHLISATRSPLLGLGLQYLSLIGVGTLITGLSLASYQNHRQMNTAGEKEE